MHDPKYTADEQDLIKDFVAEELISDFPPERKNALMQLAANNIEQDRKISVRISVRDLEVIQRRALEQGLPYQSLVTSILHKYVSGAFKEVER